MKQDMIVIIDLGSEENSLLAREIRALGVYSEIYPHDITLKELQANTNIKGIILNGGPNNVVDGVEIDVNKEIYELGVPFIALNFPKAQCEKIEKVDLKAWLFDVCKAEANWNMVNFVADQVELLRKQIGDKKVLLALSGGVDSSVVAALLIKAVGKNVTCVHVNHGLLRKGEPEQVINVFGKELDADLVYVDAVDRFLTKLEGIDFLGQGTIYPDIVESGTKTGKAVKAHHNVGGLPDDLKFELVEPLKYLFKDEVRACGKELGLPDNMVYRQPFPGPGLGVRCLGAITRDRLEAVRESDAILREEFDNAGLRGKVWQYFTLIPDVKSVGVRDNARSFEWPVIIRAVNTVDAMTATIEPLPYDLLGKITDRILSEVKGVNRVLYDITPKPTGTIEWE